MIMAEISHRPAFRFRAEARSHRGLVRSRNEDALIMRSDDGLWAVADGMGGHDRGDEASQAITKALGSVDFRRGELPSGWVQAVEDAVCVVHDRLKAEGRRSRSGIIGSTLAAVVALVDDMAACLWIGDSRVYHVSDERVTLVTRDHVTRDGSLTKAVGVGAACWLDTALVRLKPRDRLLLCTDGLSREISDAEIGLRLNAAGAGSTLVGCADRLLSTALERGARDNISLIVVEALP